MGVTGDKKLRELQRTKAEMRRKPFERVARLVDEFNSVGISTDDPAHAERSINLIKAAKAVGVTSAEFKKVGVVHTSLVKAEKGTDPELTQKATQGLISILLERI